ncbi:hypothetical protein [Pseudomonas coleopterorum]|uniref:hypothetical protein n=1 Tax=Pseudomonas coleopterorum TaxID=1605838 RepID=UPI00177EF0CC|nr:hypothetical protein [Pseudomonas coleopterorum]MBD8481433.1 hypothetical protein [Pseudomonas coleopterorum]
MNPHHLHAIAALIEAVDRLDDSEAERALLNHRLRICRANNQNLADYLSTTYLDSWRDL